MDERAQAMQRGGMTLVRLAAGTLAVCASVLTTSCDGPSGLAADAGGRDGGVPPLDVGPTDAGPPTDGGTPPDAGAGGTTDAFVPPDDVGVVVEPDAFVVPVPAEDCTLEGDENGDGMADCADPSCAPLCATPGCRALATAELTTPSEAIPTPAHWYRWDHQVIAGEPSDGGPWGAVCAWRDLVGEAHFVIEQGANRVALVAGAVRFRVSATDQARLLTDSSLGLEGPSTTFFAWSHDATFSGGNPLLDVSRAGPDVPLADRATLFSAYYEARPAAVGFSLWESGTVEAPEGASYSPTGDFVGELGTAPHTMVTEIGAPRIGVPITPSVRYAVDDAPLRTPTASIDFPLASDPSPRAVASAVGGGFEQSMHELLIYDRVLSESEIATVRGYLRRRYRP